MSIIMNSLMSIILRDKSTYKPTMTDLCFFLPLKLHKSARQSIKSSDSSTQCPQNHKKTKTEVNLSVSFYFMRSALLLPSS